MTKAKKRREAKESEHRERNREILDGARKRFDQMNWHQIKIVRGRELQVLRSLR